MCRRMTIENIVIMVKTKYIIFILLMVWILSMVYMTFTVNNSAGGSWGSASPSNENLEKALEKLKTLENENSKLMERIRIMTLQKKNQEKPEVEIPRNLEIVQALEPTKEHEILRRRVEMDVNEMWFYVRDQLKSLKAETKTSSNLIATNLDGIMRDLFEYYSVTSNDLRLLSSVDGTDQWRLKESRELADIVHGVLEKLQNPANCSESRLLLCNLGKGCGFGCQVHHLVYCLITSMATNRTLVIDSKKWRYLDQGWSKFFMLPSRKCGVEHIIGNVLWSANHESSRVVLMPIIDTISPRPNFLPLAIPRQLSDRLVRFHGNPFAWWAGQMVGYLLRFQPIMMKEMNENMEKLNFKSGAGVVGVHIRRTDKLGGEAAFHSLEEYMEQVDRYFDARDLRRTEPSSRAIYLATDDPHLFVEMVSKYPKYIVYGNADFSQTASLSSRYTEASLKAIILDTYFLSMCDHLVCTFSSQVCRLAYELMQTMHGDASSYFTSLDDIYYFGGQLGHNQIVRLDHTPKNSMQLTLHKGDFLKVAGNHWNGYSMGESNSQRGLYPSFKVLEKLDLADFPVFTEFLLSSANSSSAPSNRQVYKVNKIADRLLRFEPTAGYLRGAEGLDQGGRLNRSRT